MATANLLPVRRKSASPRRVPTLKPAEVAVRDIRAFPDTVDSLHKSIRSPDEAAPWYQWQLLELVDALAAAGIAGPVGSSLHGIISVARAVLDCAGGAAVSAVNGISPRLQMFL